MQTRLRVGLNYGISEHVVTVDWSVEELPVGLADRATAGDDFEPASGTLTFQPGEDEMFIDVTQVDDDIYEGNEFYRLVLSNPVNARYHFNGELLLTVADDETYISAARDSAAVEGDDVTFTIERSGPASFGPGSIRYETVDIVGGAVGGPASCSDCDYVTTSGILSFARGARTAQITVPTVNDSIGEPAESFELRLTPMPNGSIGVVDVPRRVPSKTPLGPSSLCNRSRGRYMTALFSPASLRQVDT